MNHPTKGGLDAFLEVPGYTKITEPISDTTLRVRDGAPLAIRWTDDFGHRAEKTVIELEKAKYSTTLPEDSYGHDVPLTQLVISDSERVKVTRSSDIELAGGVAGSLFRATTEHRIDLNVE